MLVADDDSGALLLERLATTGTLADEPLDLAMDELGRAMRRLAVAAPPGVPCTADVVRERLPELEPQWEELGRPFERSLLVAALHAGGTLQHTATPGTAVNGDLHSGQVLRGIREPWLVVDPLLMRGDIAYDIARALFTRVDDMRDSEEIVRCLDRVVVAAHVDADHALAWALYRTVDYWLWALGAGLTIDPERCRRVADALVAHLEIQEKAPNSGDPA
jgi:streptomycin 6-kinase